MSNAIVTADVKNGNGMRITDAFRRAFGLAEPPPTAAGLLAQVNQLDREFAGIEARLEATQRNVKKHRQLLADRRRWLELVSEIAGGDE